MSVFSESTELEKSDTFLTRITIVILKFLIPEFDKIYGSSPRMRCTEAHPPHFAHHFIDDSHINSSIVPGCLVYIQSGNYLSWDINPNLSLLQPHNSF